MVPHDSSEADFIRLSESLRDFYLRAHRVMDRLMASHGASLARTKMLAQVARAGAVRSTDLADLLGQAPRTITEAIDGLERDGLVAREADPHDRRAKRIRIMPKGEAALARTQPIRREFHADVFGALDGAELEALQAVIDKLIARLDELGAAGQG